jgi:hypothetical protein
VQLLPGYLEFKAQEASGDGITRDEFRLALGVAGMLPGVVARANAVDAALALEEDYEGAVFAVVGMVPGLGAAKTARRAGSGHRRARGGPRRTGRGRGCRVTGRCQDPGCGIGAIRAAHPL